MKPHTILARNTVGVVLTIAIVTTVGVLLGRGRGPVDEAYLRESLEWPGAKGQAGYPPWAMPNYEGVIKNREIRALVAYLKTL